MTKRPFSGEVAARSEVDRRVETHVRDAVESRCSRTNGFSLDRATAGDAQHAKGWSGRWKRNGDGRGGAKRGTRYLLWQPLFPLTQATLVRGAFGVQAPARPVLTQSKKARCGTSFMPLAQVAFSITNQTVRVNAQKVATNSHSS